MEKLSDCLYAETVYEWANAGAAVTEVGVVMLDCPLRPTNSLHWQGEVRSLSSRGIRFLIATDYHGDHTTGSPFIQDEVIIVVPQYVFKEISSGDNAFSKEIFVKTLEDRGLSDEVKKLPRRSFRVHRFVSKIR